MGTEAICTIAKRHNVPVLVDAAAEILTIPEHPPAARRDARRLQRRQVHPRPAERRLAARAARIWCRRPGFTARHITATRARMKVGREEMVGMLVAVESWVKRDHEAEWKQWVARVPAHRRSGVQASPA